MMELVEKFICPTNLVKSGYFSKTFRVIQENVNGAATQRIIETINS